MARCTLYTFTFASLSFAWIHVADLQQSCLHFECAVYSIMTRGYIKMQLAWLGKKLIHRTKKVKKLTDKELDGKVAAAKNLYGEAMLST